MQVETKFFLYIRKSTNDETHQVVSLDSQAVELRQLAKRDGIAILETFEESQSAKEPGRPIFNRMLDRIEKGEANGLITWDIDRLCRNPIDEGRIRWLLQRGVISEIRTPVRRYLPQDAGVLMAVEGGRASDHIMKTVYNLKRTIREKLRNGKFPGGTRPFGYAFNREIRDIVPDPRNAPIMRKIFEEVAEGELSLFGAAERLAEYGHKSKRGTPLAKSVVKRRLSNRVYMGVIKWKGEIYEGKYTPLVSPELFEKVQKILKQRSKPRKTKHKHDFPFCGIFHCPCGGMITAQWAHGHGGTYRYYRCTNKKRTCFQRYTQEKDLAAQVMAKLAPLALAPHEAIEIRDLISKEEMAESGTVGTAIKQATAELATIQEKLDRLTRAFLNPDESFDGDSFHTVKEELILQKTALKAQKERLQKKRVNSWIEPTRNVISTLETLGNMPVAASPLEIANILRKIGTNPLLANKTVTFSFSENYDFIPSLLASARSAQLVNSSKRHGDLPQNSQSSEWCAREDLNLHPLRDQILSLARLPFRHSRKRFEIKHRHLA
jgi:site-specific DNA recombinase